MPPRLRHACPALEISHSEGRMCVGRLAWFHVEPRLAPVALGPVTAVTALGRAFATAQRAEGCLRGGVPERQNGRDAGPDGNALRRDSDAARTSPGGEPPAAFALAGGVRAASESRLRAFP